MPGLMTRSLICGGGWLVWHVEGCRFTMRVKRPTKKGVVQFVFFNAGGAAFFVVGYAVFSLLYGLLHWHWLLAKVVGDTLGWTPGTVGSRAMCGLLEFGGWLVVLTVPLV